MTVKLLALALLTSLALTLCGCNTVSGLGKDTRNAGEKLHETAEDAK